MLVERYEGLNMISVSKALKNLKYIKEWFEKNDVYDQQDWKAMDMAIRALEAQLHLNMYRDFDVCEWQEDYDWDENPFSWGTITVFVTSDGRRFYEDDYIAALNHECWWLTQEAVAFGRIEQ